MGDLTKHQFEAPDRPFRALFLGFAWRFETFRADFVHISPFFFIIFDANWGAGGGEAAGSDSPGALEAAELHEARRAHCDHLTFRLFSVAEKAFHVRFRGLRG